MLNVGPLEITFESCKMEPILLPTINDFDYYIGEAEMEINFNDFVSPDDKECNYTWNYQATYSNGAQLDSNFITFDPG